MKILYHHRTRSKDGQYVHIEEMITALRDQGHEVIIVAPSSAEKESFGSDAGIVALLKKYLPKFVYELMEFSYSVVAYRRLAHAVRQHRPDCLYERYNLFLPAGAWIKRRFGLPFLLEVNSPLYEERARYDGISLGWLARWSQRYAWRSADYVLPVTKVLGDVLVTYGVDPKKVVVIPNGINAKRFDCTVSPNAAKAALGLQGKLVLGFTGFIRDWHGMDKVIDLIANDPPGTDRHLLIVGDGPVRASLEEQARRLGIEDRVTITGIVGRDDVARYVAAFDVALQPAVVAYASPLKLFEYLALGKAIVAPAQPNIMEILSADSNAVLFAPNDPQGLPKAVERLCKDEQLRLHVGENARKTIAAKRLTWHSNAERAVALFQRLLRNA